MFDETLNSDQDLSAFYDAAVTIPCDQIEARPVEWLWPDWLPLGKFCILAGAPGCGKTTLALSLAATITRAGVWPDGTECTTPGNVLIWSAEDAPEDTLIPRLMAADADLSRVHIVTGIRTAEGYRRGFDPAEDMRALTEACERIGLVRLVLVDPVSTCVAGDSHKNSETRRGLQPLVDLATDTGATVLGISHLSKAGATGTDPASRVLGSIAFVALARVVLLAAKTTTDRLLVRAKSNIGTDHGGVTYGMAQVQAAPGLPAVRVQWGQTVSGSAAELLGDAEDGQNECEAALAQELADGAWYPTKAVQTSLDGLGFSQKQVRRAREKLGVLSRKFGAESGWQWKLPTPDQTADAPMTH